MHMQASTVTVFGPDVLTSCGSPDRRLSINETYVMGVGGSCNPIPEWPTLESFSMEEVCLLRELRADESRMCAEPTTDTVGNSEVPMSVPSLLSLTLSVLSILVVTA